VDLWGRIWSQYQSAQFDVEASRDDLEAAAMTLTAQVTEIWLRILEQQELERLLAEQLETNRTYLELVELRFRKGQVSALDVFQQRQAVSDIKRLIPLAQAAEAVLRQELAVLLGKPPTEPMPVGDAPLPLDVPPLPPTGIPADLLVQRPDIRAAMARLQSADYGVAAARADLLPAIRLTGGIGYNTNDIRYLFDNWFLNVAAGLAQPLFDGFRRPAEVSRTLAVVEERLAAYRLTVLFAIQEVEEALVQETRQREYLAALAEGLEDARNALREASERYRKGLNDYLPVLAALERTQALARNVVIARRELLVFRVNLYRALGGTWMDELQPPVRLSEQKPAESPAS
jgi:NodT family efflux transporter outer membrane factor (OMF) lipoprotein